MQEGKREAEQDLIYTLGSEMINGDSRILVGSSSDKMDTDRFEKIFPCKIFSLQVVTLALVQTFPGFSGSLNAIFFLHKKSLKITPTPAV